MKRRIAYCLTAAAVLVLFFTTASAADLTIEQRDIVDAQYAALELDELEDTLPDTAREIAGEDILSASLDDGFANILRAGGDEAKGALASSLRSAGIVLVIVMLCGLVQSLYDGGSDKVASYVPLVGALAIVAAVSADISSFLASARDMMQSADIFSKGLLATLAGITGTLGKPVSAAARYMAAIVFSDVLISVINNFLLPVLYAYIAVITANAALGEDVLSKLASFLKWVCVTVLGALLTVFTAYISISGIVSGGADAVTTKTAKLVISNAIPVVGKIISDATETVLAGVQVLRGSVGIFGVIGIAAICLVPFIRLGVQYLVFKAAGAAGAPMSDKRLAKLVDDLAGAFGIMLGMVGSCMLLMVISVISVMSLVN